MYQRCQSVSVYHVRADYIIKMISWSLHLIHKQNMEHVKVARTSKELLSQQSRLHDATTLSFRKRRLLIRL